MSNWRSCVWITRQIERALVDSYQNTKNPLCATSSTHATAWQRDVHCCYRRRHRNILPMCLPRICSLGAHSSCEYPQLFLCNHILIRWLGVYPQGSVDRPLTKKGAMSRVGRGGHESSVTSVPRNSMDLKHHPRRSRESGICMGAQVRSPTSDTQPVLLFGCLLGFFGSRNSLQLQLGLPVALGYRCCDPFYISIP